MERKQILHDILHPTSVILPTLYVDGSDIELKRTTEERDWEGIVAKKKAARHKHSVNGLAEDQELEDR